MKYLAVDDSTLLLMKNETLTSLKTLKVGEEKFRILEV